MTFYFLILLAKILTFIVGIFFLFLTLRIIPFIKNFRLLRDIKISTDPNFIWPQVSLVIPVCNEEKTVKQAALSLFTMNYPNIEFIFVNDRSTDNTAEILAQLAKDEARMKIITIYTLPKGWLGKVNAFQQGLKASTSDWILFSDADVHYHKTSLKKAISYVLKKKLDFLGVLPSVVGGTFFVRVLLAQIIHYLCLLINFSKISDPKSPDAMAHGAFMLVHRPAYNKSKGFEWLKMEIIDDVALAVEMKRSGAKIGVLSGLDEIDFEWYSSVKSLVRGFEKNSFASFQYSLTFVIVYIFLICTVFLGYTILPIVTGSPWLMGFVWTSFGLYLATTAIALRSIMHISGLSVLLFPLTFLVLPWIIIRAAFISLKQKGVYWRGTFYPLDVLKKEQRLRMIKISPQ